MLAAVFGFYTFGDITYSPILCNFPRSTSTVMGAVTASTKLLIAFHVMSAYPILMTVLTTEIESSLGWRSNGAGNASTADGQEHGLLPAAEDPLYEQGQESLLRHSPYVTPVIIVHVGYDACWLLIHVGCETCWL